MSTCSKRLDPKNAKVFNTLADSLGIDTVDSIYKLYDGYERSYNHADIALPSYEFFKMIMNGNTSELFNELTDNEQLVNDNFVVAFSDSFREKYNWIEGQKLLNSGMKFKDVAEKLGLNPNDFHKKSFEPKLALIKSYSETELSNLRYDGTEQQQIVLDTKQTISKATEEIINKYASTFKDLYGINTEFVVDIHKGKEKSKGWYNKKEKKIYLVKENMTSSTPIHEMFHPILDVFKDIEPDIYISLIRDLKRFKDKDWYKAVEEQYSRLTPSQLYDELIVTAVGETFEKDFFKPQEKKSPISDFVSFVKDFFDHLMYILNNHYDIKDNKITTKEMVKKGVDIDYMATILASGVEIEGVNKALLDSSIFYDLNGKPINIDEIGVDKFIEMYSEVLEKEPVTINESDKHDIEEIYLSSDKLKSNHKNDKDKFNGGVTKYTKSIVRKEDVYTHVRAAALRQLTEDLYPNKGKMVKGEFTHEANIDNEKFSAFRKTPEFEKTIKIYTQKLEGIIERVEGTTYYKPTIDEKAIYEKYKDAKESSLVSIGFGNKIHKVQELFFENINSLKGVDGKKELTDDDYESIVDITLSQSDKSDYFSNELKETQIRALIEFTKSVELENKGRKIVYKPEFYINSSKLKKQGTIDLLIIFDDFEYDIYDAKSKKGKFEHKWLSSYYNYGADGLTHIAHNGKNDTAIQTSLYALMMQSEFKGLSLRNMGALYYDIEIDRTYSHEDNEYSEPFLKKVNLVENNKNGKLALPLPDYRNNVLSSLGEEFKDIFIDKSNYSKEGINNIPEMITYLMDGKTMDARDLEQSAKRKLNNLDENPEVPGEFGIIDKTQGKQYIEGGPLGSKQVDYLFIPLTGKTDEEKIIELEKYYDRVNSSHSQFIDRIIERQNTGIEPKGVSKRDIIAMNKIMDVLGDNYTLSRVSSIIGMEDFKDIPLLIAKDLDSGVSRLIYISADKSTNINFYEDQNKRTTILGVEYKDNVVKTKYKDSKLREANTNNFRKLITGFAATRLKQLDNSFKVDRMFISIGQKSGTVPTPIDMTTIMPMLNVVKDNFQKQKSGYMEDLFSDKIVFESSNYKPNRMTIFKGIMSSSLIVSSARATEVIDVLSKFQNEKLNMIKVVEELTQLEKEMREALSRSQEDVNSNQEYKSLMYLIQDIFKVSDKIINGDVNMFHKWLSIEHNVPESLRQSLIGIIRMFDMQIKREFETFKDKKEVVLKSMMESKNISYSNKYVSQSMISSYDNLFVNQNNYDDPDTLMTLKDPEDYTDKSLNEEEREFIRLFNDTIYEAYAKQDPYMFKDKSEEEQRALVKGRVPIFLATPQTRQARGIVRMDINLRDDREQKIRDDEEKHMMDNNFDNMLNPLSHQYNAGLDTDKGGMREGFSFENTVETNLEYIMQRFMVRGVETEMHNHTLLAKRSMESVLQGEYFMFGNKERVNALVADLESSINQYVRREARSKGSMAKFFDKLSTGATVLAVAGSGKQAVMDTLTYSLSTSAYLMSNKIYGFVGGDKNALGYFGMKAWAKSGRLILSNDLRVRRISEQLALDTSDSMIMGGDSRLKTMRKSMMEYGFIVTKNVSIATLTQLVVASMIEDGSFDAYSIDENGKLQYDEKKDRRFYDEDGKLINEAKLYAVKKAMYEEGGFNIEDYDEENPKDLIDRKIKIGYTFKEINTIKAKAVQMIGSMDKDSMTRAEGIATFKHALKFRSWLISKKDLYMMDRQMSDTYMEWKKILQPDGSFKYELMPEETEGIVYSVLSVINKLNVYKLKALRDGTITDVEKKNIAILASHLFFAAAVYGLVKSLDLTCDDDADSCWLKDSQTGKTVESLLSNVQSDMFVLTSMYQITLGQGSIFPGISLVTGVATRLLKTIFYEIPFGDEENPMEALNDAVSKSWSTWRTGREFMEIFTYDGKGDKPIKNAGYNWDDKKWDNFSFPVDDEVSSTYLQNTKENFPDTTF